MLSLGNDLYVVGSVEDLRNLWNMVIGIRHSHRVSVVNNKIYMESAVRRLGEEVAYYPEEINSPESYPAVVGVTMGEMPDDMGGGYRPCLTEAVISKEEIMAIETVLSIGNKTRIWKTLAYKG